MPSTSESICKQLNSELAFIPDVWEPTAIKAGHKIGKAAYLFTRIDDKKIEEWKNKFGGSAETRAAEEAAKRKKQEDKEKKKAKKAAKAAEAAKNAGAAKDTKAEGAPVDAKAQDEASAAGGMAASSAEVTKDLPIREKKSVDQN